MIARMHAEAGREQELREAPESLIEPTVQEKVVGRSSMVGEVHQ